MFQVEKVTVNDMELNINDPVEEDGALTISCDHPDLYKMEGQAVTIYYRYNSIVNKRGHMLDATISVPTKNIVIELNYADTDIHYVNVLDFFVSSELPKIRYLPSRAKARQIELELNDWVFPKGGVAFVWVLSKEMSNDFLKPTPINKKTNS